jgi:hypothetical protein
MYDAFVTNKCIATKKAIVERTQAFDQYELWENVIHIKCFVTLNQKVKGNLSLCIMT